MIILRQKAFSEIEQKEFNIKAATAKDIKNKLLDKIAAENGIPKFISRNNKTIENWDYKRKARQILRDTQKAKSPINNSINSKPLETKIGLTLPASARGSVTKGVISKKQINRFPDAVTRQHYFRDYDHLSVSPKKAKEIMKSNRT